MESINEMLETAPINVRFEAQQEIAKAYLSAMAGINKHVVMERGYDN